MVVQDNGQPGQIQGPELGQSIFALLERRQLTGVNLQPL